MLKCLIYLGLIVHCIAIEVHLYAQSFAHDSLFEKRLPPLSDFIDSALKHSALLQERILQTEKIDNQIAIQQKKWMDYVFIEGAANYGRYDLVSISNVGGTVSYTSGVDSKNEQIRYYGGFGLKLPIAAISSRHNIVSIARIDRRQAELEAADVEMQIRQTVIEEYYKLIYLFHSMSTFQAIYQTLDISMQKAERDLSNGRMTINEYALLASTVGKAKDDFIKAQNNFYAQFKKLENVTGCIIKL